jgi:hypothetical protein
MNKRVLWILVAVIAVGALILILVSNSSSEGRIKLDAGGAVAELELAGGLFDAVKINSGAEPAKVDARTYRPESLTISMQQGGDTWQIEKSGTWGKLSTFEVKNNETTVLRLGLPFVIEPGINKSGSTVSIDFSIFGQGGEKYRNYAKKNNSRVPAPKVSIVDEAGNVLASGRFKYG